jgi:hypothetical protein
MRNGVGMPNLNGDAGSFHIYSGVFQKGKSNHIPIPNESKDFETFQKRESTKSTT